MRGGETIKEVLLYYNSNSSSSAISGISLLWISTVTSPIQTCTFYWIWSQAPNKTCCEKHCLCHAKGKLRRAPLSRCRWLNPPKPSPNLKRIQVEGVSSHLLAPNDTPTMLLFTTDTAVILLSWISSGHHLLWVSQKSHAQDRVSSLIRDILGSSPLPHPPPTNLPPSHPTQSLSACKKLAHKQLLNNAVGQKLTVERRRSCSQPVSYTHLTLPTKA